MSRSSIRAGIAAWLGTPAITGINTIYSGQPVLIPGDAFFKSSIGATSGCIAYIQIPQTTREDRISVGGATGGKKRVDYQVELRFIYRSVLSPPQGSDAGVISTQEFDAILDAVKTRIRNDRTAGGTVWQWGEAVLTDEVGEITQTAGGLELWGRITTEATEWLDA